MKYSALKKIMQAWEAGYPQEHIVATITFTQDSFTQNYNLEARTYKFTSDNKIYRHGCGGYSLYGACIDGTDPSVRLEQYMAEELGGKSGWKVEDCKIVGLTDERED